MLLLTSTADLVRIVTGSAADVEVHASWMDHNAGVVTPGRTNTASITTATTTTVVASPAASTQRNVKHLNIYNNHASTSTLVTVEHTDGTNAEVLAEVTLLASESLVLNQAGVWLHYDVDGGTYPQVGAIATQAEMEAGTSTVTTVTPGRQHFHPSACKFWIIISTTANLASYNVTSITDVGAGVMTVTIATDFSSANWCALCSVCNLDATIDAAVDGFYSMFANASQAAGSIQVLTKAETGTAAADGQFFYVAGYGDQ